MKKQLASMSVILMFIAFALSLARAQGVELKVAANSSSGTYEKMLGELIGVCSGDDFKIRMVGNSGGAVGNLDALVNNQANAALLHSDVFLANSLADPSYNELKTLLSLWPEQIHVLTTRATHRSGLRWVEFDKLTDLAGYKVGAAGGGVITAKILKGQGDGGFDVAAFDTGTEVLDALANDQVQAAIFVGAEPLPNLQKLDGSKFKLIPIGQEIADKVSNVYRPAKVEYPNLTKGGPVATLAPICTLITRQYKTPALRGAQQRLRDCFYKNLPQLQDTGSRNWSSVDANDRGVLSNWYEIGTK